MLAALLWSALSGVFLGVAASDSSPQLQAFPQLRSPSFSYRCDDRLGSCVKTEAPDRNSSRDPFAWSQRACQVRCGRAGSLWPLPTGEVLLGSGLVVVVPGDLVLACPPSSGAPGASGPGVVRLLHHAHHAFLRRLQGEQAASRAQFARGLRQRGHRQHPTRPPLTRTQDSPGAARLDVEVCVERDSLVLDWSTDESYVLESDDSRDAAKDAVKNAAKDEARVVARIRAATFFGARHALETLSQLVTHTGPRSDGSSDGHLVLVDGFRVSDAPAFPHRGLLLDTSRNFYSPAYIRATINAMAQNKMNVLHWHITDSHSFPYESTSLPQMAAYGAYSAREVYRARTIRELSRFALSRGIRLLPELDVPAHVAAGWTWGRAAGLGDLVVCAAQRPWQRYCVEPPCGQLNPANPHVYAVLAKLFADMLQDFYGAGATGSVAYFHMGGDEVHLGCWNSSREVVDFMSRALGRPKRRKEDFVALWGHFQDQATRALDRAHLELRNPNVAVTEATPSDGEGNSVLERRQAVGRQVLLVGDQDAVVDNDDVAPLDQPGDVESSQAQEQTIPVILWTSELTAANVVEKYLDKDRYVIQLWLRAGDPLARTLVSKGYRVIVSTKDAWYLDHGFGNWKGNSTSGYEYHPWQVAYDNDPLAGLGPSAASARQVLGGEAAMWGEQADQSGASTKTWPRAAAVAERLWSGTKATTWTSARVRFVRHRDRMARLGTPSEAVQPEWCTQHEGECY